MFFLHIIREVINTKQKTRRYNIQSLITFEIYFKYLNFLKDFLPILQIM